MIKQLLFGTLTRETKFILYRAIFIMCIVPSLARMGNCITTYSIHNEVLYDSAVSSSND